MAIDECLEGGLERIVLGIFGIGGTASLGYNVALAAEKLQFVERIYLNEKKENLQKALDFKNHVAQQKHKYVVPEKEEDVENVKERTATECNVILFCFEQGRGASKGKMASAPPDIRTTLFNANIDAVVDYARYFGERRSGALFVVGTNPTDLLSYFFSKEYWSARREAEQHGKVVGLNQVDTRRYGDFVAKAIGKILKKDVHPDDVHAEMWGPHSKSCFPIISQMCYREGGKFVKLCEIPGMTPEIMLDLAEEAKNLPFRLLKSFDSTSTDTSYAVGDLLWSIHGGREGCVASYPVPVSGDIVPFMGLPVRFERGRAVLLSDRINNILSDKKDYDEKKAYNRVVRECTGVLRQLLKWQDGVRGHIAATEQESELGKNPRFPNALVLPLKTQVNEKDKGRKKGEQNLHNENWLHFLNFTYPFRDFSETRPKVRLAARAFYVDVIQLKGKSLVAVSHSNGIQVVDPVSGESDNYIIEGGHPNCCCTIDDKIIVSASNRGIFVAEKKGGTERLVPLKLFGEGFGGYVKSHKKVLYYSSGKSIFSATVGEKGLVEREVDSVPDRIYHFALHPEAGLLRIFATCSGGVYRLDMKEGDRMAESSFVRIHRSARSSGAKSRFNLIGVDYVFDDYYVIVSKDDKLLLLDRNAKEADKRSKDESIMGEFDVPGNISSFACDPFGGIVVASNTHGAPQLHHVSKGKEGKSCSSKIGLPDYDLTGYSVRSGEYAEFRRINSIVVYSQPIG